MVAEIRLGRSTDDALEALSERVGSADFKWAVLAVNIHFPFYIAVGASPPPMNLTKP